MFKYMKVEGKLFPLDLDQILEKVVMPFGVYGVVFDIRRDSNIFKTVLGKLDQLDYNFSTIEFSDNNYS
ncbi:hypothetical protein L596_023987 [Steinernema carpocapsae]|uniref:Uncharacterized protein n=1 Tax=Steinernema carpocapsae TaxID=34508 RepID=A0A4U5MG25_STECR|nr:hypothetical protein L596_023987 [Steinernema carpocapsae]